MRMRVLALNAAMAVASFGAIAATAGSAFTYQGTFADAGSAANGNYDFQFSLFDSASGGTLLSTVTSPNVAVSGGLVNTTVDFGPAVFNGQGRWMQVSVRPASSGAYTALGQRQPLTATPYALGLPMPFQRLVNTGNASSFLIQNSDGGTAIEGINPSASTTFPAIHGTASAGPGVMGDSTTGVGVSGAASADGGTGVRGAANGATGDGVRGLGYVGVHGVGQTGVWAEGGLLATDNISCNFGTFCQSVVNIQDAAVGNLIIGSSGTPSTDVFRVNGNGAVFANGGYSSSGADIAEYVPSIEKLHPGDVVEIDSANGELFRLSSHSNSTAVAGVVSTKPGVSLNNSTEEEAPAKGLPLLALSGRVPVKVTSENGAIRAGDLLVSSSKAGHAMRAPANPQAGTVIGKAMQKFDEETGEIEMLVMLR
jgi:hypothetical protein